MCEVVLKTELYCLKMRFYVKMVAHYCFCNGWKWTFLRPNLYHLASDQKRIPISQDVMRVWGHSRIGYTEYAPETKYLLTDRYSSFNTEYGGEIGL